MPQDHDSVLHGKNSCVLASEIIAVLSVVAGLTAVAGHALEIKPLKTFGLGTGDMTVRAAIALVFTGIALACLQERRLPLKSRRIVGQLAGLATIVIAGASLTLLTIGMEDPIAGVRSPKSFLAAMGFLLSNTGLLLFSTRTRRAEMVAHVAIGLSLLLAMLGTLGYLYNISVFRDPVATAAPIPLSTAVFLMAVAAGIVLSRPNSGLGSVISGQQTGSRVARPLLRAAVMVTVISDLLIDVAVRAGLLDPSIHAALQALVIIVILCGIILWTGLSLNRLEAARKEAQDEILLLNADLEARVRQRTAEMSATNRTLEAQIEERKHTEARLRSREDALREAQRNAHMGNWVLDLTTDTLTWPDEIYRIFGLRPQQFGANYDAFLEAVHPDDREAVKTAVEAALVEDAPYYITHRVVRPDGSERIVREQAEVVRDETGKPVRINGVVQDITERHLAAESLRKLWIAVEHADANIAITDSEGKIEYVNPAFQKTTGWTLDEVRNKAPSFLKSGEHGAGFYSELWGTITSGRSFQAEFVNRKKNGETFYEEKTITPVHNGNSEISHFISTGRDTTRRRLAEEEARRLNLNLERRVARRTADLTAANNELKSFAHSVSHDLRAPLRTIDGFSQALLEDYADKLDEDGRESLGFVRSGAQQMSRLIDDMLKLSRLSHKEMECEPVDLSMLAGEIAANLLERESDRKVDIEIQPGMVVNGDEALLRIALENLIGNAWKFTGQQADAKITVGAKAGDTEVEIHVSDNGVGFDMSYADQLFGPFQRAHSPDEFEGAGIGLATVQRVAHRHRGRAWAHGRPGLGATFHIAIPTETDHE